MRFATIYQNIIKNSMFKSKRFVAFCAAIVLFLILTYTTSFSVIEVASAVSILVGVYIGGETFRKSDTSKG